MSGAAAGADRAGALLAELEPVALSLSRRYTIPGAESADVAQIARWGLWEAVQSWDGSVPLARWGWFVAERKVQEALTQARRLKHAMLTDAIAGADFEGEARAPRVEMEPAPISLEEHAAGRAEMRAVVAALPALSALERRAVCWAARGEPFTPAGTLEARRLDNAFQRARRKLRRALADATAA